MKKSQFGAKVDLHVHIQEKLSDASSEIVVILCSIVDNVYSIENWWIKKQISEILESIDALSLHPVY